MFGFTRDEALGRSLYELIIPERETDYIHALVARLCSGDLAAHSINENITRNGERLVCEWHNTPLMDHHGKVVGLLTMGRNVTEREDAERALHGRTQQLETLLTSAPLGVAFFDREYRYLQINEELAAINGIPAGSHIGRRIREVLPVNAPTVEPMIDRVFATGEAVGNIEVSGETPREPGVTRHWLTGFFPVRDADGEVTMCGIWVAEITARKKAEQALRESEAHLRLALESTGTGIWVWELATDSVRWSPQCHAILGVAEGSFGGTGSAFHAMVHEDDRERVLSTVSAAMAGRHAYECEFRVRRPDGTVIWVANRARADYDDDGRPVRMIGTLFDVTPRKQSEEALKEADRRKDEFLATLAHELRNPLAPIRNGLEIIRRNVEPQSPAGKVWSMMDRQLGHLVHLVDDLLDLSRVSRGLITLRRDRLRLDEALEAAVEACRPAIEAKQHKLNVEIPAEPAWVEGDRTRLAQIVANLLTNAAKYSEAGGQITLSLRHEGEHAVIEVTDTGVGIAPELLPTIWDMFTQVRDTLDKAQGGLGIGLSLVKRLVNMHGGSVQAFSQGIGHGSSFSVRLPETAAPPLAAAPASPLVETAHEAPGRQRILVVDDNIDGAASLAMMLELFGHEATQVHTGEAALKAIPALRPDVVLLDIGLPGMDGYEVARHIRELGPQHRPTLIALTGWGSEQDKQRSRDAGFDHHLTKPVDAAGLQAVLGQSARAS